MTSSENYNDPIKYKTITTRITRGKYENKWLILLTKIIGDENHYLVNHDHATYDVKKGDIMHKSVMEKLQNPEERIVELELHRPILKPITGGKKSKRRKSKSKKRKRSKKSKRRNRSRRR
jgi:hypothetical protein